MSQALVIEPDALYAVVISKWSDDRERFHAEDLPVLRYPVIREANNWSPSRVPGDRAVVIDLKQDAAPPA